MAALDTPSTSSSAAPWTDTVHTGPGTLAGRYLRSFWQPVFVAKALPAGKARPTRILGEDFTVYRGESGQPHVVGVRCAHRGTQLSIGWVEGETLRCRYHGWRYDADGHCVEQPGEPEPFCEKIRIPSYPTEEYLGLIFAYLGDGAERSAERPRGPAPEPASGDGRPKDPPPIPHYPEMEADGYLWSWAQLHGCNFFNALDNDPVHSPFTHRREGWDWHDWHGIPPLISAEERDYGAEVFIRRPHGALDSILHGMPNISFRPLRHESADIGPTDHLQWRVPRDDTSHIVFSAYLIHLRREEIAEARRTSDPNGSASVIDTTVVESPWELALKVLRGEVELDDSGLPQGMRLVQLQDEAVQIGQRPIADRDDEHLGRSDTATVFYRNLWMRELRNLAEGRPIKRWVGPSLTKASSEPANGVRQAFTQRG